MLMESFTMSGPAVLFREIHRLRRFAHELQEQIDRLPRQQNAQQNKVARQEEILRQAQDAIKQIKVEIHSKEGTLKSTHGQIAKYQKQLNEAESKKEYEALQHEINDAKAACNRLEEEILDALGQSEEKTAQLPELEKAVRQAKEEQAQFESAMQERLTSYQTQLTQTRQQLEERESALPANLRAQYQRIVGARGHEALSSVQGQSCVACYTEITAQQYNELQQELFVLCKSCGRILYLPE
jgi:predicted  nucleic acid-binding Zn-ribbon protein